MRPGRALRLARRALHRPPAHVLRRIGREIWRQARRPWCRVRPRLLSERALLRLAGASAVDGLWERLATRPFFVRAVEREAWGRRFRAEFPAAAPEIVQAAEAVVRHELDLLGSGPVALGPRLPWHTDFKTGRQWALRYAPDYDVNELDRPSDVKVPWELSRCQHVARLGQAYWLTGDERFAAEFVAEVRDWIRANPWGYGINWACPMDVALRAMSWVWGFHFFARARACADGAFRSEFLRALYLHGEFVAANLEVDEASGNHLLVDGAGLVFLGLFFDGTRGGARWLACGRRIVAGEIQAHVHEDGVSIEQSTAYHRLALEAFATTGLLLRLHGEALPPAFWERLERMYEFVLAYTKPDGRAPLIGDADDGRIQKLGREPVTDHRYLLSTGAVLFERGDLKQAAGRFWEDSFWLLGPEAVAAFEKLPEPAAAPGSRAFPAAGFYVLRGESAHVVVDCGEVGLAGQGGHGHNDVLSFELFLAGLNVVTDCGAYCYTASREWRNRFRSTAFHNTVEVDGQELNRLVDRDELWRLRYDAVPLDVVWRPGDPWDAVAASHAGYTRLPSPVTHRRAILVHRREPLVAVHDRLDGAGVHRLTWRFHLDPVIEPTVEADAVRLASGDHAVWLALARAPAGLRFRVESGWVSPRYGVKRPTRVLVAETTRAVPVETVCVFAGRRPAAADLSRCLAAIEALA